MEKQSKSNINTYGIVACIIFIIGIISYSTWFVITLDDRTLEQLDGDMSCSEILSELQKYEEMNYNNYPKTTEILQALKEFRHC